jgi:hypothetical protein
MRMIVAVLVLSAASFQIPATAQAKIAVNRARIVSISVIEDEKKGVLLGNIVIEKGSFLDKKSDRISAKITSQTSLIGDRRRISRRTRDRDYLAGGRPELVSGRD